METRTHYRAHKIMCERSFNFLASLINGNASGDDLASKNLSTFNFLASLINGNNPVRTVVLFPVWVVF